ncbi:MAG TPA: hypothetical protein DDZ76_12850 [Xanthomonadales bacterium]|nr:hypothetical protein [Xanthomonadales bacterium]
MRTCILFILIGTLIGCAGNDGKIVTACENAVAERLGDKPFRLDPHLLRSTLQTDAAGVSSLRGPVVLDPGLSSEKTQTVECSARFEPGQSEPVVISLNFIW